jgi:Epiplasmin protein
LEYHQLALVELDMELAMELAMEQVMEPLEQLEAAPLALEQLLLPHPSSKGLSSRKSLVHKWLNLAESRVEYIPIQKTGIVYDQVERVEQVPVQRVITEYEEVRRSQTVPVERMVQDYYAVEYQTEYVPRVVEEKVIDYVQQERHMERVQYVPYER